MSEIIFRTPFTYMKKTPDKNVRWQKRFDFRTIFRIISEIIFSTYTKFRNNSYIVVLDNA